jgi:hypothetical protein
VRARIKELIAILTDIALRHKPNEAKKARRQRIADLLTSRKIGKPQRIRGKPCHLWTAENVRKHERKVIA